MILYVIVYLSSEHTVEQRLQAALEELISKQPEDPICYLADQ